MCPLFAGFLGQFTNTNISHIALVLRLKVFDAVMSPAMLFGPATLPLTKVCLQKLGVVQRRTLRCIVGWV